MKGLDEKEIERMIDESISQHGKGFSREFYQKSLLVAYSVSAADVVLSNHLGSEYARTALAVVKDYKFLFNYSKQLLSEEEKKNHRDQIENLEKVLGSSYS